MTKAYEFNWKKAVPEALLQGCIFDRWEEEKEQIVVEQNALFKVDDCGFFIFWKSDGKDGSVLELSQVNDIRRGGVPKDPRLFQELSTKYGSYNLEDISLTICSGADMVNINYTHIVCPDPDTAIAWQAGLRGVTNNIKANNLCPSVCLMKHWIKLGLQVDPDGKLPVRRIAQTFASGKTEKLVYQCIKEVGLPNGKTDVIAPAEFTVEKFEELYLRVCPRNDIEELFEKITQDKQDFITTRQLVSFLNDKQRDPRLNEILYPFYDERRANEIIARYETNPELVAEHKLSQQGLCRYLMSDENAPVFLDRLDIYMDMDQPLSHYYINSSHNTYLTGRQFGGKSSVEMYRQVLIAGCRCVELDCWDGKGEDEEPIITHGKAMCTDILFRDVIYAIRDCAFLTSDYPVILSFENHCSKRQQYKLAKYCYDIFGELLLTEPLLTHPLVPGAPLPSPNDLKRKILIKNKRLRPDDERREMDLWLKGQLQNEESDGEAEEHDASINVTDGDSGVATATESNREGGGEVTTPGSPSTSAPTTLSKAHDAKSDSAAASNTGTAPSNAVAATPAAPAVAAATVTALATSAASSGNVPTTQWSPTNSSSGSTKKKKAEALPVEEAMAHYRYTGATTHVHPFLSSLVNYAQPVKFQGFDVAEEKNVHHCMSSFAENNALGYLKSQAIEFVNYNKRQLSRIYPKGTRADSSNFLPQIFWNAGCQMVALNFQTPDLPMQLNQGKFEYNGGCGYLLKPDFMRRPDRTFDPFAESPVDGVIAAQCSVRVISGQFLSDKKVGTYVEVDMYGLPTDTIRKECRTRIVPNNGLNPVYNEEPFVFRKVVLPDLAVIRIAVYDENGKMLGQRILPMDGLQAGYRHVSLRTEGNFPMSLAMLFICIELKIYVPDGLGDLMDALSDPRAFLSAQEKRLVQMRAMGVEDADLVASSGGDSGLTGPPSGGGSAGAKRDQDKQNDAPKLEPITLDQLKASKEFVKLKRKQQKELDSLAKKQSKEKHSIQKHQTSSIEKMIKQSANKLSANDDAVQSLVGDHADQWSALKEKHAKDYFKLLRDHTEQQGVVLKALLVRAQQRQMKALESRFETENKAMKTKQARVSVETAREVSGDKTLRNKAERERRLREKNSNNTKKFIEERKTAAFKQNREREKVRKVHEKQLNDLLREIDNSVERYNATETEILLNAKKECYV